MDSFPKKASRPAQIKLPCRFGKYILGDHIFSSAMSDLYLAQQSAGDGPGRFVVIKTPQTLDATHESRELFAKEIKIGMALNHPNIVRIFEVGEIEDQPFIAMEWIRGKSFKDVIDAANDRREEVPAVHALEIMLGAAQALQYAHQFQDPVTGEYLTIVHRDLSPNNIMITYDGQVKLIDFGIAKAISTVTDTVTDVIRGKPPYMSPEHILGEKVDQRSDLFSMGSILYEAITGRRAFMGDTDYVVLEKIRHCDAFPPDYEVPGMQGVLKEIIQSCLKRDPGERFLTAEGLVAPLQKTLASERARNPDASLKLYLERLFQKDIADERAHFEMIRGRIEEGEQEATATMGEPAARAAVPAVPSEDVMPAGAPVIDLNTSEPSVHLELEKITSSMMVSKRKAASTRTRAANRPPEASRNQSGGNRSAERARRIRLEREEYAQPRPRRTVRRRVAPPDLRPRRSRLKKWVFLGLLLSAIWLVFKGPLIHAPWIAETMRRLHLPGAPAPTRPVLKLKIFPEGGEEPTVLLGRKQVFLGLLNEIEVEPDKPFRITVLKESFQIFQKDFLLTSEMVKTGKKLSHVALLEPKYFGKFSLRTVPPTEIEILGNGLRWSLTTPVLKLKMPPGTYVLTIRAQIPFFMNSRTITVQPDLDVDLSEPVEIW